MKELKILKELEYNVNGVDEVLVSELRAEAIKWINKDMFDLQNCEVESYGLLMRWMRRFNITSEDLTDGGRGE